MSPADESLSAPGLKAAVAELGGRLVDVETHPGFESARATSLRGVSAAAWEDAEARLAGAWATFRTLNDLATEVEASGGTASEQAARLRSASVPAADGQADPPTALTTAQRAVESVAEVVSRLSEAWSHSASRLAGARSALADLLDDREAVLPELHHAASRVAGLPAPDQVVTEAERLPGALDRIAASLGEDPLQAVDDLDDWLADAGRYRAELDSLVAAARDAMERRDEHRGLWKAMEAKATARRVAESQEVSDCLQAARDLLWTAPCDLGAAEEALAQLGQAIDGRPGGGDDRTPRAGGRA